MERVLTARQLRNRHLRDMGAPLGAVYNALTKEVSWLHAKWNEYRQLFGHSSDRVAILREVAGFCFGVIQRAIFEDVLIHVARLTDRPETCGKENLTLQLLPKLITDTTLAKEVDGLLTIALSASESARIWRNRRLAHKDLALSLVDSADPLPGISRADVEITLRTIRAVLNRMETHYWASETAYEHFITGGGDADCLMHYLQKGVAAEKKRIERLRQGEPLPEDFGP